VVLFRLSFLCFRKNFFLAGNKDEEKDLILLKKKEDNFIETKPNPIGIFITTSSLYLLFF